MIHSDVRSKGHAHEWLWPEARKMTIGIGVLTSDGIVLAADTEETTPTRKASTSKIIVAENPLRTVAVVGAGPDCHIETMAELLVEQLARKTDYKELKELCRKCVNDYYADHVLRWPTTAEREDNDFALLIAISEKQGNNRALWVTRQSTLRDVAPFSAVGLGATYARSLLRESYIDGNGDMRLVIPVAIDVIRRVKRDVTGCGKETEVKLLINGVTAGWADIENEDMESLLSDFERLSEEQFMAVIAPPDLYGHTEFISSLPDQLEQLRQLFDRWINDHLRQAAAFCNTPEERR